MGCRIGSTDLQILWLAVASSHNRAPVVSCQKEPAGVLNFHHKSDGEAFGIRLCNRMHFVNRSLSVFSVVMQRHDPKTNTHADSPLDIHVDTHTHTDRDT